jgi:centrosomal protein CEP164
MHQPGAGAATSAATQRRLQTAREVKQIEESWKTRLHDVSTRLQELQQQVSTQQETLQKSIYQPPEALKKSLEARNTAELAQLRETIRKQNEVALQRLKGEHAAELAKAAAEAAETVSAEEKLSETTASQRAEERKVQNAAMLAALQAAVEARQAELSSVKEMVAASTTASDDHGSSAVPPPQELTEQDKAAIAAAQAAADAEVAEAKKKHDLMLAQLRADYEAKKNEKEASATAAAQNAPTLSRVSSTLQTPTGGLSRTASNSSFSVSAVSPGEQAKLNEEDQKLKEEAERAARIYEEETELMVANREAGRPLTAAPLPSAAANVSAEAVAALGRTATQNQRARDAENARHSMTLKQLEAKHEQAVRLLKTQHDKAMAANTTTTTNGAAVGAATFNPRQHPSFTAQLNARKRSWIRDHPAPSMEMPTLTPIPSLPAATMSATMVASTMPDPEEQAKIIKTRLAQTREELRHRYDRELQALQHSKEGDVAEWQKEYRATRLAGVQQALEALKREKDAEVQRAKATAAEQAEANASAAAARRAAEERATAAANARLATLQASLQAVESKVASEESACNAAIAALEAEITQLESTLLRLTADVDAEEKRREEQRAKSAAVAHEAEELIQRRRNTPTSFSAPHSAALFISDTEAAEEENALRIRWMGLLKSLRAAVQHEMENYEHTLTECSKAAISHVAPAEPILGGRAAVSVGRGDDGARGGSGDTGVSGVSPGSLPPTVPVSAGPLYQSSLMLQEGGAAVLSAGFVTPLQRPPLSSNPDHRSFIAEGVGTHADIRARYVPTSPLQPQQQGSSWANLSGAFVHDGGLTTSALNGGGVRYQGLPMATPHGAVGMSTNEGVVAHMPCSFGSAENSRLLGLSQPPQFIRPETSFVAVQSTAAATRRGMQPEPVDDNDQAMRLAALQEAVRERRHELQTQRREMEQLREEWREDMRLCKQRGDAAQARELKAVKEVLEKRARRLNAIVLETKAMQHEVQNEVRRYRQWVEQQQQQQRRPEKDAARGSAATTSAVDISNEHDGGYSGGGVGAAAVDVVGLLEGIVARTERLEKLLARSVRSFGDTTPSQGRSAGRR